MQNVHPNQIANHSLQITQTPKWGEILSSISSHDIKLSRSILTSDIDPSKEWGQSVPPQYVINQNCAIPFHWMDSTIPIYDRMIAIRPYDNKENQEQNDHHTLLFLHNDQLQLNQHPFFLLHLKIQ